MLRSFRIHGSAGMTVQVDETREPGLVRLSLWQGDHIQSSIRLTPAGFEELCRTRDLVEYAPEPSKPKLTEED